MKTFGEALAREDARVAVRLVTCEAARRRLLPYLVAVCEAYGVVADDILDSRCRHPHVVLARDVVTYLAWEKCKLGPSIIADILKKSRPETSKKLSRLRQRVSYDAEFAGEIARVVTR